MIDEGPAKDMRVELAASHYIGLIREGEDLPSMFSEGLARNGVALADGDVIVTAEKIVLKAEGCCA